MAPTPSVDELTAEYAEIVDQMRKTFDSGKTRSLKWRKEQLRQLIKMYVENHEEIAATINADMGGTRFRAMGEIAPVTSADDCLANIDEWARDRWVGGLFDRQYIRPEPKGVVLIIAPWNVPWQLTIRPLTAAIAAGNVVVMKPSELNPRSAPLIEKLDFCGTFVSISNHWPHPHVTRVVQGAVAETTALLNNRWDHIFYTGNGQVGRIVMTAAAQHLTPVTLELGGKSPVIVDETALIDSAVKRIALMKWSLSGQICVAPDYIFVHQSIEKEFIEKLKAVVIASSGQDGKGRVDDFGMIVNEKHVDRLENLIQTAGGTIICGGAEGIERKERFVPPTVIHNPKMDAPIMQEEIFGPVLPVLPYDDFETALKTIRSKETPLAFYVFSQDSGNIEKALSTIQSGGVCINTVFEHLIPETLPFGGQGASGMGAYHGKFGFDEFSHKRAILVKSTLPGMRGPMIPLPEAGKPMPSWVYPLVMKLQFGFVPQSVKSCWRGVYAAVMAPIRRLFFA
eukprot:symbB.v1.2.000456.t1/scaffold11.1/size528188/5